MTTAPPALVVDTDVLIVGVDRDSEWLDGVDASLRVASFDSVDDAIAALDQGGTSVSAVVLGSLLADPVKAARQVAAADTAVAVVLAAPPEKFNTLRQRTLLEPLLPSHLACVQADRSASVVGALDVAVDIGTARRRNDRAALVTARAAPRPAARPIADSLDRPAAPSARRDPDIEIPDELRGERFVAAVATAVATIDRDGDVWRSACAAALAHLPARAAGCWKVDAGVLRRRALAAERDEAGLAVTMAMGEGVVGRSAATATTVSAPRAGGATDLATWIVASPVLVDGEVSHAIGVALSRRPSNDIVRAISRAADLLTKVTPAVGTQPVEPLVDEVTGLPNRARARAHLLRALDRSDARGTHSAVLFINVDHFRLINESHGHDAGDTVLRSVADRVRQAVGTDDTVARFGADEFVVVAEDIDDTSQAIDLAQRIAQAVARPIVHDEHELYLTISTGISISEAGTKDADALLREANTALSRAKVHGRDRCEMFDPQMRSHATARLELGSQLRRALERDEFWVAYQPVVSMMTGRILGAEALVRWEHPTAGSIGPHEFIPVAEELGIIGSIGRFVMAQAFADRASWPRPSTGNDQSAGSELSLAINVSSPQLRSGSGLVDDIERLLRHHDADPACINVEITESVLMDDVEAAIESLSALRALGVKISIDDFGTGYSSLAYLRRLPVDDLKIDRSFITPLGGDQADQSIVEAIVAMAHALDLDVIAEGVETMHQRQVLESLGCDKAQGYLFGKPMSADAFASFLNRATVAA